MELAMKLIGMLDSPFVRRVAISLDALGVQFEHEAVSVFSTFERIRAIKPVVKAPTLVCEDGGILMDSGLILQYVESEHFPGGSPLWSRDPAVRLRQFRAVAHASAAAEKVVQFVYEVQLRPATAQHEPWKKRVRSQFTAAFAALESQLAADPAFTREAPGHASIWPAVVWQFTQSMIAIEVPTERHPRLSQLSRQCEALPLFQRWPAKGPGVPSQGAD
jgi:glutathione S-transferase